MKKIFEFLGFGKKEAKEKIKKQHGDKHHDCNFGIENFNKTKRSKEFVEEINTKRRGKPTGGGGGYVPPPPPPPSSNSPVVFLLDFNGGLVSGTSWNVNGDLNIAYSGLTQEEIDQVVAECIRQFTGFNVKVTTDEAEYNAAAATRRMRCYITESWEWYGQSGGVSFEKSAFWGSNTPCFVFSSLLGYVVRKIQAAVPHELGHTVGLKHQSLFNSSGVKISEYNPGDGVNSPTMGYPYSLPNIWWTGQNSNNVYQDDAAVIHSTTN